MNDPKDILDQCIDALRAGRDPEEILRRFPEDAPAIRPLLELLPQFDALPQPQPTIEGLMRTLARSGSALQTPPAPSRTRRLMANVTRIAAVVALLFIAGWGISAVSSSALPGDFLYPVKLWTERVRFRLALNPADRAELRIVFSEKRLIEAMRRHQRDGKIDPQLLKAMLDEAQKALDETRKLPEPTRDLLHARIADVWEFQGKTLEDWSAKVDPRQKNRLQPFVRMCRNRCGMMRRRRWGRGPAFHGPEGPRRFAPRPGCRRFPRPNASRPAAEPRCRAQGPLPNGARCGRCPANSATPDSPPASRVAPARQ